MQFIDFIPEPGTGRVGNHELDVGSGQIQRPTRWRFHHGTGGQNDQSKQSQTKGPKDRLACSRAVIGCVLPTADSDSLLDQTGQDCPLGVHPILGLIKDD